VAPTTESARLWVIYIILGYSLSSKKYNMIDVSFRITQGACEASQNTKEVIGDNPVVNIYVLVAPTTESARLWVIQIILINSLSSKKYNMKHPQARRLACGRHKGTALGLSQNAIRDFKLKHE